MCASAKKWERWLRQAGGWGRGKWWQAVCLLAIQWVQWLFDNFRSGNYWKWGFNYFFKIVWIFLSSPFQKLASTKKSRNRHFDIGKTGPKMYDRSHRCGNQDDRYQLSNYAYFCWLACYPLPAYALCAQSPRLIVYFFIFSKFQIFVSKSDFPICRVIGAWLLSINIVFLSGFRWYNSFCMRIQWCDEVTQSIKIPITLFLFQYPHPRVCEITYIVKLFFCEIQPIDNRFLFHTGWGLLRLS